MTKTRLQKFVKDNDIRFIRVLWNDNANLVRAKMVNIREINALFEHGIAISKAQQAVPFMYDVPELSTGLGPVGEVRIKPDWDSLKIVPHSDNQAWVLGNIYDGDQPWSHCPRTFLLRMMDQLSKNGLLLKVGFENEFFVYENNEENTFSNDGSLFAENRSIDSYPEFITQLTKALEALNIGLELYHAEAGPSQYEFSLSPDNPINSLDNQIYFKETVKVLARRSNLKASFVPKLYEDQAGSGCHLHLSLWKNGKNITPSERNSKKISEISLFFIAGVLKNLPSLLAITTPTTNSFRRLAPRSWAGAYTVWGYNNREAAVRIPSADSNGAVTNIEFKTVDHTANLYLALGAIIASGLDGIEHKTKLSNPIDFDPGAKSETELNNLRIERLPTKLSQSLDLFKKNRLFKEALGDNLHKSYHAVKSAEAKYMKGKSFKDEVALMVKRF